MNKIKTVLGEMFMAVPQSKQTLLEAIRTTYSRLAKDLALVPAERARDVSL